MTQAGFEPTSMWITFINVNIMNILYMNIHIFSNLFVIDTIIKQRNKLLNETAEAADTRSMIELLSHISIDFDSRWSFLFNINRFCCTKYILFTHLSFLFAFNETLKYQSWYRYYQSWYRYNNWGWVEAE